MIALGRVAAGLADLDRAISLGAGASAHAEKAGALAALGRRDAAIEAWTAALDLDPDDARAYLGRARLFRLRRDWDSAVADLERAADRAGGPSPLFAEVLREYRACLTGRPDHRRRVEALAARGR